MAVSRIFWLVVMGCLSSLHAEANNYFVATNGSDANLGTSVSAPFRTLAEAGAIVKPGDTCFICGGVYHETLSPNRSGTSNAPITFAAYTNEVATIDGADAVTNWTFLSNGIYQASVSWDLGVGYDQVFVDGVMIHEAQYPNYGSGDVMHPAMSSVTVSATETNVFTSADWSGKPDNYWAGAWFVGGIGLSWAWQSAQVASSTGSNITVNPATETATWWFTGSGKGYLFGLPGFLNSDNEWFLQTNSTGNALYLRISGGADPSTHTVEMKHRNWCVGLVGRNYITLNGLHLWGGASVIEGNGNVLENCQGQFLSHFMIISEGYYENDNTEEGGGVAITGNGNVVRGCTLCNTAGCGVYTSGSNNVITRNLIYNTDYSGTYACAVALHGSGETVTFNTMHSSGRDVLRPEGTGSDIRFNDLSYPGLLDKDLGLIYVWGVDSLAANGKPTRIAYNWVHDNDYPLPAPLIYLDNYDQNFVIDHNVCWNSGGDSGIRINAPAYGHLIYNNTLFNCTSVGAYPYDSWPNSNPDPALWTNDVDQYSASNNLFLATSPQTQLVNWTNENFCLKPGAPAIDAGAVIPGFTDGYSGSTPDLGAYDFGGLVWTAGVASRPTLAIRSSGSNLTVTASPDAAYYQLYTATNLTPPARWTVVTNVDVQAGEVWSAVLPGMTNRTCYYRLQAD